MKNKRATALSKVEGFTIIEIMIVATIIMFISAFGLATYNEISRNSRDAKRQGDLDSLRNAVELYKTSDTISSSYPKTLGIVPTQFPAILKSVPQDPKNIAYNYTAYPPNCDGTAANPCTSYTITVASEKVTNGEYIATPNSIILTTVTPTIPTSLSPTATINPLTPTLTPTPTGIIIVQTNTPIPPTTTPTPLVNVGCNLTCSLNSQCSSGYCYAIANRCRNSACDTYSDCTCPAAPTATPIASTATPIPATATPIAPTSIPIMSTATPIPPTSTPTPITIVGCNLSCALDSQCSTGYCYSTTGTCRTFTCPDYSDCTCPAPTATATPIPPTSTPTSTPIPATATPIPTSTPTPSQQTITVAINSGNDDAYQDGDQNKNVHATQTYVILGWPTLRTGLRFNDAQLANISQKTIVSASISFSAYLSSSVVLSMNYYGEKVANCAAFAEIQNNLGARTLTTNFSPKTVGGNWVGGSTYNSPSLTAVIQEIVDQPSYGGGAICILINEVASTPYYQREMTAYEHATYQEPRLTITYLQ